MDRRAKESLPSGMRLLLPILLLSACTAPPEARDDDDASDAPADPAWSEGAPLLAPLQENGVVVWNGEVVVIGGFDDTLTSVARVEAYDPAADSWRSLPDLPEAMHHANVAVVDDVLYVLGGNLGFGFTPTSAGWALRDGGWESVAPMPAARARGSAAVGVIDGAIVLAGGLASGAVVQVDVYDPGSDSWSQRADLPVPRDHGGGCVLEGALHQLVGREGSLATNSSAHHRWDPDADAWSEVEDAPTARGGVAVASDGRRCVVIGGEGNGDRELGTFGEVEVYDGAWSAWPELPLPIHGTGAAIVDGFLYVPGGADRDGFGPVDALQIFGPLPSS